MTDDTYAHRMQLIVIQTEAAVVEREYWELRLAMLKEEDALKRRERS